MASLDQSSAKGPLSYILRYFPAGIDPLDNAPTDEGALTGLARWLIRWHVKANEVAHTPHYTLPGKMRERLSKAPNAGQFLQACELLHDSLTERLAIEPTARQLLGVAFSTENWQAVRDALKWWAGWIKEQGHSLVRQYLDALKTIPVFQNVQHQWDLNARVCDNSIEVELNPLAREFKYVYVEMKSARQKGVLLDLLSIAKFDTNRIAQYRAQHEQGDYQLEWLIANLKEFHFKAWDGRYPKNNQVAPNFWGFLQACASIRQGQAKAILIELGDPTFSTPFTGAHVGIPAEEALPAGIPSDFSLYIKAEYREKLLPFLKEQYKNKKAKSLTCMLFALHDLGALTVAPLDANQTELHEALEGYFGNVGVRQALNISISKHGSASAAQQIDIEKHRKILVEHIAKS